MSLTSAAIDLSNALKTATEAWEDAQQEWDDAVRRDFAANQWEPLENQIRSVMGAMDRLSPILSRAMRDCA